MATKRRRSFLWRVVGATLAAIVMWGFVSMSGSYETIIELPVRVELPGGLTLTRELPSKLRVLVRASGWSHLKIMFVEDPALVLVPVGRGVVANGKVVYGQRELSERLRSSLPDATALNFYPDSLTLAFGTIINKKVPVRTRAIIQPRPGFQIIGNPWSEPDSVILIGAPSVLDSLGSWPTSTAIIPDVHGVVSRIVSLSDSMRMLVQPQPRWVEVRADVQEIGERTFADVPLIDRVTLSDSTRRVILRPDRIEVLLRGGVRDLSQLDPMAIRAYVEVVEGVDTLGVIAPRLILPPGVNLSVVRIIPERVKYVFRREE